MLLVQFGGIALRCLPLTWGQQGICIGIGAMGLVWSLLIKMVVHPEHFEEIKIQEDPITEEEAKTSVMMLRKNTSK
jgi:hypothetical protein